MSVETDAFLEHHGIKGMHWGRRGTARSQRQIDRAQRVATGKSSLVDKFLVGRTKKGAAKELQILANRQAKMRAGGLKTQKILANIAGVKVDKLNYHTKGDPHGKMLTTSKKVALGAGAAVAVLNIAGALSKNL